MTRNEFIDGGIRILGVYFFIGGVLELPGLLQVLLIFRGISFIDSGYLMGIAWVVFHVLIQLAVGWYLLNGGKWFNNWAVQDNPAA